MVACVRPPRRLHMGDLRQLVRLHVGTQGDPSRGDGGTHSPDICGQNVAVDQRRAYRLSSELQDARSPSASDVGAGAPQPLCCIRRLRVHRVPTAADLAWSLGSSGSARPQTSPAVRRPIETGREIPSVIGTFRHDMADFKPASRCAPPSARRDQAKAFTSGVHMSLLCPPAGCPAPRRVPGSPGCRAAQLTRLDRFSVSAPRRR